MDNRMARYGRPLERPRHNSRTVPRKRQCRHQGRGVLPHGGVGAYRRPGRPCLVDRCRYQSVALARRQRGVLGKAYFLYPLGRIQGCCRRPLLRLRHMEQSYRDRRQPDISASRCRRRRPQGCLAWLPLGGGGSEQCRRRHSVAVGERSRVSVGRRCVHDGVRRGFRKLSQHHRLPELAPGIHSVRLQGGWRCDGIAVDRRCRLVCAVGNRR